MVPGLLEAVVQAKHEDYVRKIEQKAYVESVQVGRVDGTYRLYPSFIHWVGVRLVSLGLKLQGERMTIAPTMVGSSAAAGGSSVGSVGVSGCLQSECCQ